MNKMKKTLALMLIFTLCFVTLTGCGGDKAADDVSTPVGTVESSLSIDGDDDRAIYSQDVDITNSTGVDIVELYISQSEVDDWEEELLQGTVFKDGETKTFVTDVLGSENTTWDFLVIDEDGDEIPFFDVSLSSVTAIEIHWGRDGLTPTISPVDDEYYSQDVYLTNSTGVAIMELYITTSGDSTWGTDLLEGRVFAHNETRPFFTDLVGTADDTWDIMIVDEDGDEVFFTDISFSSSTELTLTWGPDGQTPTITMT